MQMVWKKTKRARPISPCPSNLPFHSEPECQSPVSTTNSSHSQYHGNRDLDHNLALSERFQSQGNNLAEEGKYGEALGKWEAALALTPERAVLHEQKAQVLLEIGETWKALKAATRATELQPSWPEAWVTLSRAQLNFGEPELSYRSTKKALELQPHCKDAQADMEAAQCLMANKRRLEQTGLVVAESRYTVGDPENGEFGSLKEAENVVGASHGPIENSSPKPMIESSIPMEDNGEISKETIERIDEVSSFKGPDRESFLLEDRGGSLVKFEEQWGNDQGESSNVEDWCQNEDELPLK
eukprot:Gb_34484 [translate_table: standard]